MLVTRRNSSLMSGQIRSCHMYQEDADDAYSFLPALNICSLDLPSGAIRIAGEAATPWSLGESEPHAFTAS
jgi:hypothetical protein